MGSEPRDQGQGQTRATTWHEGTAEPPPPARRRAGRPCSPSRATRCSASTRRARSCWPTRRPWRLCWPRGAGRCRPDLVGTDVRSSFPRRWACPRRLPLPSPTCPSRRRLHHAPHAAPGRRPCLDARGPLRQRGCRGRCGGHLPARGPSGHRCPARARAAGGGALPRQPTPRGHPRHRAGHARLAQRERALRAGARGALPDHGRHGLRPSTSPNATGSTCAGRAPRSWGGTCRATCRSTAPSWGSSCAPITRCACACCRPRARACARGTSRTAP